MADDTAKILRLYAGVKAWVDLVEECLGQLTDQERRAVEGFFGVYGGVSVPEMEIELSRSRATVFRLKARGLTKLSRLFALTRVALFWDDILEHTC